MQRLVNRTAEYYWQEIEFQSMVYDRTTFILANTFADGPFPSALVFKGDFSIVNDSFNHLNMTLNRVELNFETFSGRKPKFSKQYWHYIFDHGEASLRSLRINKYQIEDFVIPSYLGAALTQAERPLLEFKVIGCEVKEVKERAFKNFTALEIVDLSDNHLTTLPENLFSRNLNLQKILLANNQITFLTKTIFDGLPNLLLINLRKNKLTAVPAIPRHTNRRFQPMVYLMAENSIHCRCSLIWVLHELTFHHNLEIEATCSDPTMVRGMPIIEGFTRMDKEACYRVMARKDEPDEDEPLALAPPAPQAQAAAPQQTAPQLTHAVQQQQQTAQSSHVIIEVPQAKKEEVVPLASRAVLQQSTASELVPANVSQLVSRVETQASVLSPAQAPLPAPVPALVPASVPSPVPSPVPAPVSAPVSDSVSALSPAPATAQAPVSAPIQVAQLPATAAKVSEIVSKASQEPVSSFKDSENKSSSSSQQLNQITTTVVKHK